MLSCTKDLVFLPAVRARNCIKHRRKYSPRDAITWHFSAFYTIGSTFDTPITQHDIKGILEHVTKCV